MQDSYEKNQIADELERVHYLERRKQSKQLYHPHQEKMMQQFQFNYLYDRDTRVPKYPDPYEIGLVDV